MKPLTMEEAHELAYLFALEIGILYGWTPEHIVRTGTEISDILKGGEQ